jgi:hypothetical protein
MQKGNNNAKLKKVLSNPSPGLGEKEGENISMLNPSGIESSLPLCYTDFESIFFQVKPYANIIFDESHPMDNPLVNPMLSIDLIITVSTSRLIFDQAQFPAAISGDQSCGC